MANPFAALTGASEDPYNFDSSGGGQPASASPDPYNFDSTAVPAGLRRPVAPPAAPAPPAVDPTVQAHQDMVNDGFWGAMHGGLNSGLTGIGADYHALLGKAQLAMGYKDAGLASLHRAQLQDQDAQSYTPAGAGSLSQAEQSGNWRQYLGSTIGGMLPGAAAAVGLTAATGGVGDLVAGGADAAGEAAGAEALGGSLATKIIGKEGAEAVAKKYGLSTGADAVAGDTASGVPGATIQQQLAQKLATTKTPGELYSAVNGSTAARKVGEFAGGVAAGTVLSGDQGVDDVLKDPGDGSTMQQRAQKALVGSLANGTLQALPSILLLHRFGLGKIAEQQIAKKGAPLLTRMLKEGGEQAAIGGGTNAVTALVNGVVHNWITGQHNSLVSSDAFTGYLNSLAAGAVGGAVMGGAVGGAFGSRPDAAAAVNTAKSTGFIKNTLNAIRSKAGQAPLGEIDPKTGAPIDAAAPAAEVSPAVEAPAAGQPNGPSGFAPGAEMPLDPDHEVDQTFADAMSAQGHPLEGDPASLLNQTSPYQLGNDPASPDHDPSAPITIGASSNVPARGLFNAKAVRSLADPTIGASLGLDIVKGNAGNETTSPLQAAAASMLPPDLLRTSNDAGSLATMAPDHPVSLAIKAYAQALRSGFSSLSDEQKGRVGDYLSMLPDGMAQNTSSPPWRLLATVDHLAGSGHLDQLDLASKEKMSTGEPTVQPGRSLAASMSGARTDAGAVGAQGHTSDTNTGLAGRLSETKGEVSVGTGPRTTNADWSGARQYPGMKNPGPADEQVGVREPLSMAKDDPKGLLGEHYRAAVADPSSIEGRSAPDDIAGLVKDDSVMQHVVRSAVKNALDRGSAEPIDPALIARVARTQPEAARHMRVLSHEAAHASGASDSRVVKHSMTQLAAALSRHPDKPLGEGTPRSRARNAVLQAAHEAQERGRPLSPGSIREGLTVFRASDNNPGYKLDDKDAQFVKAQLTWHGGERPAPVERAKDTAVTAVPTKLVSRVAAPDHSFGGKPIDGFMGGDQFDDLPNSHVAVEHAPLGAGEITTRSSGAMVKRGATERGQGELTKGKVTRMRPTQSGRSKDSIAGAETIDKHFADRQAKLDAARRDGRLTDVAHRRRTQRGYEMRQAALEEMDRTGRLPPETGADNSFKARTARRVSDDAPLTEIGSAENERERGSGALIKSVFSDARDLRLSIAKTPRAWTQREPGQFAAKLADFYSQAKERDPVAALTDKQRAVLKKYPNSEVGKNIGARIAEERAAQVRVLEGIRRLAEGNDDLGSKLDAIDGADKTSAPITSEYEGGADAGAKSTHAPPNPRETRAPGDTSADNILSEGEDAATRPTGYVRPKPEVAKVTKAKLADLEAQTKEADAYGRSPPNDVNRATAKEHVDNMKKVEAAAIKARDALGTKTSVSAQKVISRDDLRKSPDTLFAFGDNDRRAGMGGQAAEMRGENNAVGVRTKAEPNNFARAFWSDDNLAANKAKIDADMKPLFDHAAKGGKVVLPADGLGTGRARLKETAPRTFEYLQKRLDELRGNARADRFQRLDDLRMNAKDARESVEKMLAKDDELRAQPNANPDELLADKSDEEAPLARSSDDKGSVLDSVKAAQKNPLFKALNDTITKVKAKGKINDAGLPKWQKMTDRITKAFGMPNLELKLHDRGDRVFTAHDTDTSGTATLGNYNRAAHVVSLSRDLSQHEALGVLLHEIGHHMEFTLLDKFSGNAEFKAAMDKDFEAWKQEKLGALQKGDATDMSVHSEKANAFRNMLTVRMARDLHGKDYDAMKLKDVGYLLDHHEYIADRISQALLEHEGTQNIVGRTFAQLAHGMKMVFDMLRAHDPRVNDTPKAFRDFVQHAYEKGGGAEHDAKVNDYLTTRAARGTQGPSYDEAPQAARGGSPPNEPVPPGVEHGDAAGGGSTAPSGASRLLNGMDRNRLYRLLARRDVTEKILKYAAQKLGVGSAAYKDFENRMLNGETRMKTALDTGMAMWKEGELVLKGPGFEGAMRRFYEATAAAFGHKTSDAIAMQALGDYKAGRIGERDEKGDQSYNARDTLENKIQRGTLKRIAKSPNTIESRVLGASLAARRTGYKAEKFYDAKILPIKKSAVENLNSRLRDTGIPELHRLAALLDRKTGEYGEQSLSSAKQQASAANRNRFEKAIEGLSDKQRATLLHALRTKRGDSLTDPALIKAHAALKTQLKAIHNYMSRAGVRVGNIEDYWPIVIDPANVTADGGKEFKDILSDPTLGDGMRKYYEGQYRRSGSSPDEAKAKAASMTHEDMVNGFYNMASMKPEINKGGITYSADEMQHEPGGAPFHPRVSEFLYQAGRPDLVERFAKFQTKDLRQVMYPYIDAATKKAEFTRRFVYEKKLPHSDRTVRVNRLQEMYDNARKQGASEKDIKLAGDAMNAAMGVLGSGQNQVVLKAFKAIDSLTGSKLSDTTSTQARTLQQWLLAYQNLRSMGLGVFGSAIDPLGAWTRSSSLTSALRGFRNAVGARGADYKAMADVLGITDQHILTQVTSGALGDDFKSIPGKINHYMFKWNGQQAMANFSRVMATATANDFLLKHAAGANEHSARYLKELGLTAADVERDTTKNSPVVKLNAKTERAIYQFVEESVINPRPGQRTGWMNDPHFAFAAQYKNFMFAFYDTIAGRMMHEAKNGNAMSGAVLPATGYLASAMALELAKEMVQYGPGGNPSHKDWGAYDYAEQALIRSGLVEPEDQMDYEAAKNTKGGSLPYESLAGPSVEQSHQLLKATLGAGNMRSALGDALPLETVDSGWFRSRS